MCGRSEIYKMTIVRRSVFQERSGQLNRQDVSSWVPAGERWPPGREGSKIWISTWVKKIWCKSDDILVNPSSFWVTLKYVSLYQSLQSSILSHMQTFQPFLGNKGKSYCLFIGFIPIYASQTSTYQNTVKRLTHLSISANSSEKLIS